MINFFKRIKIRAKLLLAFGSIILLSVMLTVYAFVSIARIISLERLKEESEKLSINLERIELAAKEFIFEGYKSKSFQENYKSEILDRYTSSLNGANDNLKFISENKHLDADSRKVVQSLFQSTVISQSFRETTDLLKRRGFKDHGLEGSLRSAIHNIENSKLEYDRADMLTLRRHEKDFLLRKDLKYALEFNSAIDAFRTKLQSKSSNELINFLNNYQSEFNQVVEIEKEIGLTEKDGKKGQLFTKLQEVRTAIEVVQKNVHQITEDQIAKSRLWLIAIFLIQFSFALALALVYSNVLTSVIKEIRGTMGQLADGVFPATLKVYSEEEIGQTKKSINQFLERLKSATSFAEKLGSGRLNATYDDRFGSDVFAKALINMQTKLSEAEAAQSVINWNNQGIARFNEVLKNEGEELAVLCDKILKSLVLYVNANQGAIYTINKEEGYFDLMSTYAYGKKRFREEKIDVEFGLIGQCVKEKESIYTKEVPANYVKITSGLGEATPRSVLIVPLKSRDEVNGVLELASFDYFEKHHITFIEKIAENISSIIANRQVALRTKKLLDESKIKAEGLVQQEEELRQSAEELQATQEEMNRQRAAMELEIKLLKEKLKRYESNPEEEILQEVNA